MNDQMDFEFRVASHLADEGVAPPSDAFYDDLISRASDSRQRPRWLALIKESPMRTTQGMAVGSPMARVAALAVTTLLLATLLVSAGIAGARLLAADAAFIVAQDGSGDFTTISDAVAVAEDGDTVEIRPGTYVEAVAIDKDITLAGDGPREEIVVEFPEGGPTHFFLESDFSFPMVLQGSDATVRGLSVHVPLAGGGILVQGGAPELTDLSVLPHPDATVVVFPHPHPSAGLTFGFENGASPVLRDSAWIGHLYSGSSSPTIEDNTITSGQLAMDGPGEAIVRGNTFLDGAVLLPDADLTGAIEGNDLGTGLILVGPGSMTVQGNEIRGLRSIQYGEAAIRVEDGSSTRILGNRVADSDGGIQVEQGAVATIEGNQLTDNDVAILWQSSEAGAIEGNSVSGGERGIVITDGDPLVVGNTVCGSGSNLVISERAEPRLGENEICADGVASPE